jgi:hypothetical protein
MDFLLDGDGDHDITGDEITLTEGAESVRQHWQVRNKFFLGEYFLDRRLGVAYYESILVKNPNEPLIRSIFRRVLVRTPGVASVARFDMSLDVATRRLSIDAEGVLDSRVVSGDPSFRFVYEQFIIPDQVEGDLEAL